MSQRYIEIHSSVEEILFGSLLLDVLCVTALLPGYVAFRICSAGTSLLESLFWLQGTLAIQGLSDPTNVNMGGQSLGVVEVTKYEKIFLSPLFH